MNIGEYEGLSCEEFLGFGINLDLTKINHDNLTDFPSPQIMFYLFF